jgi:hypothetical protein
MGLFSWLLGFGAAQRRKTDIVRLAGNGAFDCPVVDASRYQDNLEALFGECIESGVDLRCVAFMVPAVRVELMSDSGGDARAVGYLSREDAADYHEQMAELGLGVRVASCRARVVRGSDRGSQDSGFFRISLDLIWPVEPGSFEPWREGKQ